ncbi:MAG: alpha/beta hydrolase [Paracoccaceae bacterium]|jgi:acetyl esterase/lipase|nr:alpha/beta hydrolase [Paracoccaceae bacterium]MDG1371714.1 alpha/beta hydrolase [Paracoccaceae bacterium]
MFTIDPAVFRPESISAETAKFNEWLEAALAEGPALHEVPPALTRQARLEGKGLLPSGGPLDGSDWRPAPTEAGEVRISLPKGDPSGIFIHIHGGGWTIGSPTQCDDWMQYLAAETGCVCVSIKYRLGPEEPWPACADDCEAAAVWVIEELAKEYGTDRIAIGGESAGAHLSAVTLNRLKARGIGDAVHGALFHYGVFDLAMTPSMANWGDRNMILSTPTVDWFADNLVGDDPSLLRSAQASPILADLSGMPPALFQVGTVDPLIDDTLFMAQRWMVAGSEAAVNVYPGGVHAFDMFDITIAKEARAAGAAFLKDIFS